MARDNITKEGVEFVAIGVGRFVKELERGHSAWSKLIGAFRQGGEASKESGASLAALTGVASAVGAAAGMLAVKIGEDVVGAFRDATDAVVDFGKESLFLAGRFQEMELAALAVGRSMGLQREEIESAIAAVQEQKVRYDIAAQSVALLSQHHVDLAKAVDVARVAQGLAVVKGKETGEMMETLVRGITTHNTQVLRYNGLMVDLIMAEKRAAAAMGITRAELTGTQKVQIALNEVLRVGAAFWNVYDAAMESPTKQLRSLTGRELPTLMAALGAPFTDAWAIAIKAVRDFVNAITELISEGGALYPILINLGAATSLVAEQFAKAMEWITNAVTGMTGDTARSVARMIEDALLWGFELIAAFAEGIVSATTTVLTSALNFVGSILEEWLLGASPPKIAPGIVKWGINAMSLYLHGMTLADFNILKKVQGPLKSLLEGPEFANMSKRLAQALAGGDRESFLKVLSGVVGPFGQEIAELAAVHFKLADAVKAVQTAEENLEAARQKFIDSQEEVAQLTAEYNEALRAGADRTQLNAQLALINAAEDRVHVAKEQIALEEKSLKDAKEQADALKGEASLQEALVQQLLEVNRALIPPTERERRERKKKGIPPLDALPTAADFPLVTRISEAIDAAKERLRAKFELLWAQMTQPFKDAWLSIQKDIGRLGETWDRFTDTVGQAWDKLKEKYPFLQAVEDWTREGTPLVERVGEKWEFFGGRYAWAWGEVEKKHPTLQKIRRWLGEEMPKAIDAITGALVTDEFSLYNRWKMLLSWLKTDFWPWMRDTLWPKLVDFANDVITPLEEAIDGITESFQWWYDVIIKLGSSLVEDALRQLNQLLDFVTGHSPSPLERGLRGVTAAMQELGAVGLPNLGALYPQASLATAPYTASRSNYYSQTNHVGPFHINNGMDQAAAEAMIRRVLRQEFV
jgi:hypothetical protein